MLLLILDCSDFFKDAGCGHYDYLRTLLILVDTPLDLQPVNDGMKMQPRWELKNMEEGAFFWNRHHRRFDYNGSRQVIDETLFRLIEDMNVKLAEALGRSHIRNLTFEVRPVFAIRR